MGFLKFFTDKYASGSASVGKYDPLPTTPGALIYASDSVSIYAGKSAIQEDAVAIELGANAIQTIDFATAGYNAISIEVDVTAVTAAANFDIQGKASANGATYGDLYNMYTNTAAGTKLQWASLTVAHRVFILPGPLPPFMRLRVQTTGGAACTAAVAYQLCNI